MSRKALCVGINRFKNLPGATLQGCVNDAHDMGAIVKEFFGFTKSEITTLVDAQATKTNFLAHLKSMVEGARSGKYDYLMVSFSSHGTQVPDTHGDEPDRYDEAFCPHDVTPKGNRWDSHHIILDDELHDLLVRVPREVLVEVFLDTCHSGTGLKAVDLLMNRKPRFLPPPSLEAFEEVDGRAPRGLRLKLMETPQPNRILWAACRDNQTSADAYIGGAWHGAFTYYLCKEIRSSKNTLSRAKILQKVRKDLEANHYPQIPQLECDATLRDVSMEEMHPLAMRVAG